MFHLQTAGFQEQDLNSWTRAPAPAKTCCFRGRALCVTPHTQQKWGQGSKNLKHPKQNPKADFPNNFWSWWNVQPCFSCTVEAAWKTCYPECMLVFFKVAFFIVDCPSRMAFSGKRTILSCFRSWQRSENTDDAALLTEQWCFCLWTINSSPGSEIPVGPEALWVSELWPPPWFPRPKGRASQKGVTWMKRVERNISLHAAVFHWVGWGCVSPLCKCHLLGASFLRQINTLETYRKACFPTAPIQSILSQCIIRKNHLLADVLPSSMVYGEYLHILWLALRWPVVLRILEERLCLSAWFASLFEVDVYASTIEWCLKTDGDFWKMLSRTNLWNLWRRMQ